MAFDQSTRNHLQKFVSDARTLLNEEFTRQLQNDYGLDPHTGTVSPFENLGHLDDTHRETARILRDTLDHYLASSPSGGAREALERIIREQAFTVLNRLAALRMTESRGILIESVGNGYQSKGFQLYERLAGPGLGETGDSYRCYLFSIFDEFALDLKVLFDRFSPQGRLFPRETALLDLLKLLNDPELAHLWAEDETIGWIYQYFNSKEERKKMRDESAAPRNSRELAVRNQFFTPRYVVEFLTDNTLGRIWYEMTQGETGLKDFCRYLVRRPAEIFLKPGEAAPAQAAGDENLSQEELIKQPVHIPHRPLKDPRTIRMLDPACGSMHFGLYSFDLYERIYEEAWELELRLGGAAFVCEAGLKPFIELYTDKETFLRDVPRLIIEHNIHGIDIDPRAVQIAGLSLWLRAQRSWHNQGMKPVDRPRITRSNIVCAEPMPGEKELLREFTARLEIPALGYLVEKVFDKMELAGEAGSLLKIEEEIRYIIAEAKRLWKAGPKPKQMGLFGSAQVKLEQTEIPLDFSGITDERFWEEAEENLYQALKEYADVAGEHGYQRRLFAEDAARGFAFICLCRKRYDVSLMNPPFGEPADATRQLFKECYPIASDNVAVCFMLRGENFLLPSGLTSSITDCSWAKKHDYKDFRAEILLKQNLNILVHLGWGVLDNANVETNFIVRGTLSKVAFCLNIGNFPDRDEALMEAIANNPIKTACNYLRFSRLPNAVFAFGMKDDEFKAYNETDFVHSKFMRAVAGVKSCNSSADFRVWWEIPQKDIGKDCNWQLLQNGSPYCPYHYPAFFAVRSEKGLWIQLMANGGARPGEEYYSYAGIAFGKRTDNMYGYIKPRYQVFSQEGQALFPLPGISIWGALALVNSTIYSRHANYVAGQHKYHNYLNKICLSTKMLPIDNVKAKEAHLSLRDIDAANENTNLFVSPLLRKEFRLDYASDIRTEEATSFLNKIAYYRKEIDETLTFALNLDSESVEAKIVDYYDHFFGDSYSAHLVGSIWFAYCFGIILGRWDIRFSTGEKPAPELPDPLAPLPACPPGMLQNTKGIPAEPQDVPADYPLRISWSGILVEDEGHTEDIGSRIREVIEVIWKEKGGDIEHEVCDILSVRSLRNYFAKPSSFFADHLKRYSKSRRQAPIYWPLSTPSGSYTLWIYYHRLNDQTPYTCVMDYVEPKLRDVAGELTNLRQKGSGRNRDDEKKLEKLQEFDLDLQKFRDELLRLARLPWKPNLNDGVQITAAPLWKLFQLPKWKKILKETWEKLEKGDYDWAHLAYSIWPDRVREKCKKDKSLAIAHDLEDLYEEPPASAKKKRGKKAAIFEKEEA